EGADELEPAEDAEDAVIAPAGRLGVEMAADQHRRQAVVRALAAREHGAHRVDAERQSGILAPTLAQEPALAIGIGQGLPVAAAAHAGPDLGDFVDRPPQALAIDAEIVGGSRHPVLNSSWGR